MFEICIKAFLIPTKLVYGNPLKLQMFLLIFIILSESKVEVFFIKVLNYLHKKMGKGFSVLKYYIVERDFRGVYEELIVSPSVTL